MTAPGSAVALAQALASGSGDPAKASASQTAGAGVQAGPGGASSMLDQVGGSTNNGALGLYQSAFGGQGGAAGGAGGAAYSGLSFNDALSTTQSASAYGAARANGGYGGAAFAGQAGAGGHAKAALYLAGATPSGYALADGGSSGGGGTGAGGAAKAVADVVSTGGYASGKSSGNGGGGTTPGAGVGKSKVVSTAGSFQADASSGLSGTPDGLVVESVNVEAAGLVATKSKGVARAEIAAAADAYDTVPQAVAFLTGLPGGASTAPVFTANSVIASAFGASPAVYAMGEVGGQRSGAVGGLQTVTDTLGIDLDPSKFPASGNLEVGLFNQTTLGAGLKSLAVTITGATGTGDVTLFSQTFTTLASAQAFFTDNAISLGALSGLPRAGGVVQLSLTVTLQTDTVGEGFYGQVIIGDPPTAAPAHQFVHAMAGLGAAAAGSAAPPVPGHPITQPVLAAGRFVHIA